jgi:hypothetical protein
MFGGQTTLAARLGRQAGALAKDRALKWEERTMNLTLVDKNGNRIESECTFAQRFTSL